METQKLNFNPLFILRTAPHRLRRHYRTIYITEMITPACSWPQACSITLSSVATDLLYIKSTLLKTLHCRCMCELAPRLCIET